jgi:hypothetical protein
MSFHCRIMGLAHSALPVSYVLYCIPHFCLIFHKQLLVSPCPVQYYHSSAIFSLNLGGIITHHNTRGLVCAHHQVLITEYVILETRCFFTYIRLGKGEWRYIPIGSIALVQLSLTDPSE